MLVIKEGVGTYPAEIVEWATVQALARDKIITIGEIMQPNTDEEKAIVDEFEQKANSVEEIKTRRTRRAKLEDVAEG